MLVSLGLRCSLVVELPGEHVRVSEFSLQCWEEEGRGGRWCKGRKRREKRMGKKEGMEGRVEGRREEERKRGEREGREQRMERGEMEDRTEESIREEGREEGRRHQEQGGQRAGCAFLWAACGQQCFSLGGLEKASREQASASTKVPMARASMPLLPVSPI